MWLRLYNSFFFFPRLLCNFAFAREEFSEKKNIEKAEWWTLLPCDEQRMWLSFMGQSQKSNQGRASDFELQGGQL